MFDLETFLYHKNALNAMQNLTRELWRKALHILIGTVCLAGAWLVKQLYGTYVLELVLAVVLAGLVLADVLIADYGWKLPLYHNLQRKHEIEGLHTATFGLISCIIAYKLFALPIAVAATGMLIYGDAAAAIVGIITGSGRKKIVFWRTFTMLACSVLIGWLVFGWIGIVMGVVATIAECMTSKIDDTVTIPIFAGIVGQLLLYFL